MDNRKALAAIKRAMPDVMFQAILEGKAADIGRCRTPDGLYDVTEVFPRIQDKDLCDGRRGEWIWSVGEEEGPTRPRILAATDARFYKAPGFRCLWLR